MELTTSQYIGKSASKLGHKTFSGQDPVDGQSLPGVFCDATDHEVDAAVTLAEMAFRSYRDLNKNKKADFLEAIADEIVRLGDTLVQRAMAETALPQGRIEGERGRTVGQLKLFAQVVREGSWVEARIDAALPDRSPMPRSDIRQMLQPLGPVAIFGASNFPLAFSVAGGDTASALAAGCTIVIKGHPAHPGTSELVFLAMLKAAASTGMPDGVVSLLQGSGHEVGVQMVTHPLIKAVGFTGSFRGGKALFDLANQRAEPIPVFAEMGSTNPVFLLPGALQERSQQIAEGLAGSVTLGVGQFCTNPGLVMLPEGAHLEFKNALREKVEASAGGTMLTEGIKTAYEKGIQQVAITPAVEVLAQGQKSQNHAGSQTQVFLTSAKILQQNAHLAEEVFGPSTVLVQSESKQDLLDAANALEGHLTATVHGTPYDLIEYQDLIRILERKVGRIVINSFPTGVEVCHAMVHGGPYPATTHVQSTSVGTNAIKRFVRPVCYQDFPDELLPEALKQENPLKIWRLVNGAFTSPE